MGGKGRHTTTKWLRSSFQRRHPDRNWPVCRTLLPPSTCHHLPVAFPPDQLPTFLPSRAPIGSTWRSLSTPPTYTVQHASWTRPPLAGSHLSLCHQGARLALFALGGSHKQPNRRGPEPGQSVHGCLREANTVVGEGLSGPQREKKNSSAPSVLFCFVPRQLPQTPGQFCQPIAGGLFLSTLPVHLVLRNG